MKTATEESVQLDRMIAPAERIANRLQTRWDRADIAANRDRAGRIRAEANAIRRRRDGAWDRYRRLVDLRDSAAIPTR